MPVSLDVAFAKTTFWIKAGTSRPRDLIRAASSSARAMLRASMLLATAPNCTMSGASSLIMAGAPHLPMDIGSVDLNTVKSGSNTRSKKLVVSCDKVF